MARTCEVAEGAWVLSRSKRVFTNAPAPASKRNEAVICVTAKMRRRRRLPPVTRTLLPEIAKPLDASPLGRRGTKARKTAETKASATPIQSKLKSRVRPAARTEKRAAY